MSRIYIYIYILYFENKPIIYLTTQGIIFRFSQTGARCEF